MTISIEGEAALQTPRAGRRAARADRAALALLVMAWAWLYHPVFAWLAMIYPRDDFRVNLFALLAASALVAARARSGDWRGLALRPSWRASPLVVALGGACAYLASERLLDINILSAGLFVLSTYGLLGLWLPAAAWRAGWPAALLVAGTLPFGAHMQVFVGLPVRVATADAVARALAAAGVAAASTDAILTLERSVARVDLPCSGVQSLWTGGLFLLGATWLEHRRIGWRWLAVAAATALLLLAGNASRVLGLVVIGDVLGAPEMARLAHAPLGVLAFGAACAAAMWLLRCVPRLDATAAGAIATSTTAAPTHAPAGDRRAGHRTVALAGAVVVLALLYRPRPTAPAPLALPDDLWPRSLAVTPDPLSADEEAWLARDGAERAERIRFVWPEGSATLSGSATVVASATWRAQHLPERCLEVYGLRLASVRTAQVADGFPVRVVALSAAGAGQASRTAVYWFQSATRLTDDYATRIAADLAPKRERWVLVALLFDADVDPASSAARSLASALRASIARSLASSTHGGPS